jgi:hypothetical protein
MIKLIKKIGLFSLVLLPIIINFSLQVFAQEIAPPAPTLSATNTQPSSFGRLGHSCPIGWALDPANNTICRKLVCPQPYFYDTNNRRCAPAEGELKVGELQVGTTGFTPSVNIPCAPIAKGTCPNPTEGIAQYVARIYQFSLMVVGLLALAGLVLGAVKYILSAGNIVSQEDARDQMKAAIFGILILLGAYLILRTINPDLVTLRNPSILKVVEPVKDTKGGTPTKQSGLPSK